MVVRGVSEVHVWYWYTPTFIALVLQLLTMEGELEGEESWVLGPSQRSLACYNAIRSLVEKQFLPALRRCDKDVLKLATGMVD